MQHDGNGGADAQREALGNGSPNNQPISKVVQTVPHDDDPSQGLDAQDVATQLGKLGKAERSKGGKKQDAREESGRDM